MKRDVPSTIKYLQILLLIGIVILLMVIFRVKNPLEQVFYEQFRLKDQPTKIFRLNAMDRPVLSNVILTRWASLAAISLFNYNANDYQQKINDALDTFFTTEGADMYYKDFMNSMTLVDVLSKNLIVTAVSQGAPVILREGPLAGSYTWKLQMPILITYSSLSEAKFCNYIATMLIVNIPTWQSPKGIGVSQFWLSDGKCKRRARRASR